MRRLICMYAMVACGCAAFGTPPARVELAGYGSTGESRQVGRQVSVGASTASASTHADVPVDLVAGYLARHRPDRVQHGSFIELSRPVWRSGARRAWLGGRGELYWNRAEDGDAHAALLARIYVDITGTVSAGGGGGDTGAAVHGRYGVGVFFQLGGTLMADGSGGMVATMGAAVRLPGWLAVSKVKGAMF